MLIFTQLFFYFVELCNKRLRTKSGEIFKLKFVAKNRKQWERRMLLETEKGERNLEIGLQFVNRFAIRLVALLFGLSFVF